MSIILNNTVLRTAEAALEKNITSSAKEDYLRIVVAGLKVALHGGIAGPFAKMAHTTKRPIEDCVNGAIALVLHMRSDAKGVMPLKSMVPAMMTLMLHALDLVDKAGVVKVGKPELVEATKLFMSTIFNKFQITPEKLADASRKAHALVQDPASLAKINHVAGIEPAPGAAIVPGHPAAKGAANGV